MDLKSPGMMDHPLYARPVPPKRIHAPSYRRKRARRWVNQLTETGKRGGVGVICNRVYGVELAPRRTPQTAHFFIMVRKGYEEPPRSFAYKNAAVSIGKIP
jgi:hypothetical protein